MQVRFRVLLPLLFGLLAITLMAWDIHNQRDFLEVADMGGDPTPANILAAVNAPVFALTLFGYEVIDTWGPHYFDFILLPPILLWWWWVGSRLDFGMLGPGPSAAPRRSGLLLVAIAIPAVVAGIQDAANAFQWWQGFHAWRATDEAPPLTDLLTLIRPLGSAIWYVSLGVACCVAAIRLTRHSQLSTGGMRTSTSRVAIGFFVVVLLAEALRLRGFAPELITRTWRSPDSFASVSGTIGDEDGIPINGVLVEIVPVDKHGEDRHHLPEYASTDARGTYAFKRLNPGTYVLGVNCHDAPDGNRPYRPTFYPGVETKDLATRIAAVPKAPKTLNQLRLRRLRLAKLDIDVRWEDGSRPLSSNLEFYNLSYPAMGVIGHESPGVLNGVGHVMVPEGFVYDARAHVGCDAGKVIETRESLPLRKIAVSAGSATQRLSFILPGPRCELWRPPKSETPR